MNFDLLEKVKNSKIKKFFLGIGGIDSKLINNVVNFFNRKKIILLNGFQGYPTGINNNNLNNICYLKKKYYKNKFIDYGFADHESSSFSNTLMLSSLANGAGANYIEKHFTLSETSFSTPNFSRILFNVYQTSTNTSYLYFLHPILHQYKHVELYDFFLAQLEQLLRILV